MTGLRDAHFTAQILAPHTDTRLAQSIYADWLEERGDMRGELIREATNLQKNMREMHSHGLERSEQYLKYLILQDATLEKMGEVTARRWFSSACLPVVVCRIYTYEEIYCRPVFWWGMGDDRRMVKTVFHLPVCATPEFIESNPVIVGLLERLGATVKSYPSAEEIEEHRQNMLMLHRGASLETEEEE